MISLTGDVATGKKVLQAAAPDDQAHASRARRQGAGHRLRRCRPRGGGRRACSAFGYYNAGQDCTAACRIYAGKKVYDKLVADLSSAVAGPSSTTRPDDDENEIGPLISATPARPRRRLRRARARSRSTSRSRPAARRRAATASSSSRPSSPARCRTTRSCAREVFGPVVSVTRFDDVEQAVAWANDSDYGLASSVWTTDVGKGHGDGRAAAIRLHLDQHPLHAGQRDAAWRPEASRATARICRCTRSRTTPSCAT